MKSDSPKFRILSSSLAGFFALSVFALAGSLTPPGAPGSTMNTLAEIFDSIAGTFDSSGVVADQNGSLIEHLKYIEANMGDLGVGSDSLDFDEFVDNMTLDDPTSIDMDGNLLTFDSDTNTVIRLRATVPFGNYMEFRRVGDFGFDFGQFAVTSGGLAVIDQLEGGTRMNFSPQTTFGTMGTLEFGSNSRYVFSDGEVILTNPLQVGGVLSTASYSRFGVTTTTHGLVGSSDVLIGEDFEVDGVLYADGGCVGCGGVTSDSLDFDEFVDAMTLDADTSIASVGFTLTIHPNVGIGGAPSTAGKLIVDAGAAQFPVGIIVSASNHATSERATLQLGSRWQLLQDKLANGTTDFGIYNANSPAGYALAITTTGSVSIGWAGTYPQSKLQVIGNQTIGANWYSLVAPTNGLIVEGNVGIGDATPTTTLDVAGSASVSGNFELSGFVSSNLTPTATNTFDLGTATLRWRDLYLASSSLHIGASGDEAMIDYNVTDDYLSFKPDGSTTRLAILDGGSVGIGTTTPDQRLDVTGNITASTSGNVDLILNSSTNNDDKFTIRSVGSATNARLAFLSSASTELMTIASSGNVGIGTATPTAKLDIPAFAPPTQLASKSIGGTPATAHALTVQGRYAYFTAGTRFHVFDVSVPSAMASVSSTTLAGTATGNIVVDGGYAYTGNTVGSIQIFDVFNPAAPLSVSTTSTGCGPNAGLYVQGRYLYTSGTGAAAALCIIDISNPASPRLVSRVASASNMGTVYVQGRYAYFGNAAGFSIYNVADPSNPTLVGGPVAATSSNRWTTVQGRYAYTTSTGSNRVFVTDVANPSNPTFNNSTILTSQPTNVIAQGRFIYAIAATSGRFDVWNITNPTAPTVVGTTTLLSTTAAMAIQGRYAYVTEGNSLVIIDIGSSYIQQLETGSIEAATVAVRNNFTVNNDADIRGGLVIGRGLQVTGPFSVTSSVSGYKTFTINPDGSASISGNFGPTSNDTYSLGSSTLRWKDLYVASGSLHIGTSGDEAVIDYNVTSDYLAFKPNGTVNQFQLFDTGAASISNALFVTSSGHVGIGTTNPSTSRLAVQNDDDTNNYAFSVFNAAGSQRATFVTVGGAGGLRMYSNGGVEQVNVQATGTSFFNGGNVGIGTSIPTAKLAVSGTASVSGNIFMTGLNAANANDEFVCRDPVTGEITFGATCTASSIRFKKNVEDLNHGLDWVRELRPVTFDWKHNGAPSLGFIAEEVNAVTPLLALYQDGEVYSVNYQIMTSVLARAIQELDLKVETLAAAGPMAFDEQGLFDRFVAALADIVLRVRGLTADEVRTDKICVGDTCVTEEQFQAVFGSEEEEPSDEEPKNETPEPSPSPSSAPDTPQPTVSSEPEPTPTPEENGSSDEPLDTPAPEPAASEPTETS